MTTEMLTILLPTFVAAIAAPVGAWVGSVLQRRKYEAEIQAMRADIDARLAGVRGTELDNVRKSNDMLADRLTELNQETKRLRQDVRKLQRAIERIPSCPHAADCPVSRELQNGTDRDEERDQPGADQ